MIDKETFEFYTDLEPVWQKGEDPEKVDRWLIRGYASTSARDRDNEVVNPLGLDIKYFLERGWINYNHSNDPDDLIGVPIKGSIDERKFYLEGELLKSQPKAKDVWNLAVALHKAGYPRKLGLSIEGKIIERDKDVIKKAIVYNVSVCPHPINPEATFEAVIKGLAAGYAGAPSGATQVRTGGSALISQSLDEDVKVQTYEPVKPKVKSICEELPESLRGWCENLFATKKAISELDAIALIQLIKGLSRKEAIEFLRRLK